MAARRTVRQFEDESCRSQHKAGQQRRNGPRTVQPWPQNPQNKARGDWRADVRLDALQINVKLAADVMNKRNPEKSEHHHETRRDTAEVDELLLRSHRTNLFVEIQS